MSRSLRLFLILVLAGAALAPAFGELPLPASLRDRYRGPVVRVRDVEGVAERVKDGKLPLRFQDFAVLVLKNNTEIHLTRLDLMTAQDAVLSAKSPFDPRLTLGWNTQRSQQPQYTQISGADTLSQLNHYGQFGFSQALSTGQTVDLGFYTTRISSNSAFNFFNPSIFSGLTLGVTQPLLANRNNMQARTALKIAKTQLLITTEQSEARVADYVAQAAQQYWDAVQARDSIRVAQLAVDLAQKSYDRDKMALDLGALSKLDIYQSQSQVAQRKVELIRAQFAYRETLDGLRRLIGADLNPATRSVEIVLEDDPSSLPITGVLSSEEALKNALDRRPELKVVRRRYSIDEMNAKVARNSMLPRLDLGLQAGGNGLGGNQIPITGPLGGPTVFIPGGLGDALSQMFRFQSPFYGFSLQMTLPVRSSQAQANLADALVNRARDQYQQRQLEQQVIQEVKRATNQIEMANAQIEASKTARDLAQKNVDAQQQRYEIGGITPFELLDAQNRLASVEGLLVSAYTNYQRSLVAYKRATWTLLDDMGVAVEPPKGN
jgi:outer membrane protein TolC